MVNRYPIRLNRSWSAAKSNDLLEISEELEVPVDKESSPNREQWIRKARKSPLETAMVIRQWLEEEESFREQTGMPVHVYKWDKDPNIFDSIHDAKTREWSLYSVLN